MPADPDGNLPGPIFILLIIIFIVLGAAQAASESFFINVNEKKLKKDAENGNKNAQKLAELSDKRQGMVSALQFGMALSGFLTAGLSAAAFTGSVRLLFPTLSAAASILLSAVIVIVISALIFFTVSDFLPKKITAHRKNKYNYGFCAVILCLHYISLPFMLIVNGIANLVVRLFGYDPNALEDSVTEEEIMMIVGEGEESGAIEENEKDMIENVLDFNDTTASEIMTHRTDIAAVEDTDSIDKLIEISVSNGLSRIPVYHEDIDSIVGICYVKDLLPYIGKQVPEFIKLTDIMRSAYFIPESKKCSQLFEEMTEKKVQIAVIVDEYGGTSGLITLEDLIESIVGNIQDEYDNEEEEIYKVSESEFTVDGTTSIDEVSDLTDTELPEGDYDTIAGLITEKLGRILKENEHPTIEISGLEITVIEVDDQRISKLLIRKKLYTDDENQD